MAIVVLLLDLHPSLFCNSNPLSLVEVIFCITFVGAEKQLHRTVLLVFLA
jgi:hypothetical protein